MALRALFREAGGRRAPGVSPYLVARLPGRHAWCFTGLALRGQIAAPGVSPDRLSAPPADFSCLPALGALLARAFVTNLQRFVLFILLRSG